MSDVHAPLSAKEFFTPEFLRDPYPTYRRYLDGSGLQFLTLHGGVWAAFKHADCSTFLRDARLSAKRTGTLIDEFPVDKQKEFSELARTLSLWMLFLDPPEHTRLRKLMNKGFSPVAIESLRLQVERIVDRLLTPLRKNHRIDILPQFVHPLPACVIAELLCVPESLHQQFVRWSNAVATLFGNPYRTVDDLVAAQQAIQGLTSYFREAVVVRRRQRGNDLISLLMEIEEDGDVLTEEELYAQCVKIARYPRRFVDSPQWCGSPHRPEYSLCATFLSRGCLHRHERIDIPARDARMEGLCLLIEAALRRGSVKSDWLYPRLDSQF